MYQEYFKLRMLPFAEAPDPEIFYLNPVYEAGLTTLRYGLLAKKGLVVLTGANGTGKTALLRKLFHDLGRAVKPVWIRGDGVSFDGLLTQLLAELNVKPESTGLSAMIEALQSFLIESAKRQHFICLIIEDAQNLVSETLGGLRQLSNWEANGQKLLQLLFVGPPEFVQKLDAPELRALKQRVALHVQLAPLSRNEVGQYINFRLKAAGYQGRNPFDPGAISRIAHFAAGIPRMVNTICDNALLIAYRNAKTEVSQALIAGVVKDMGLVRRERLGAGAPFDSDSWTDLHDADPDAQSEIVWANFQTERAAENFSNIGPPPRRSGLKIISAALLLLIAAGATAGILRFDQSGSFFESMKTWTEGIKSDFLNPKTSVKGETIIESPLRQTGADLEAPAAQGGDADGETIAAADRPSDREDPAPPSQKFPGAEEERSFHRPARSVHKDPPPPDAAVKRRLIEIEIEKAIQNRAIEGVTVRLEDSTAILGGRVASVRQRALAERAAMSVTEVAKVNNQISIQR